jgi:hypothetical protein
MLYFQHLNHNPNPNLIPIPRPVAGSATPVPVTSSTLTAPSAGAGLSALVSAWIDLQNSVNCFIDSDKDPNPLGTNGAPSGIRQILERKEGDPNNNERKEDTNSC